MKKNTLSAIGRIPTKARLFTVALLQYGIYNLFPIISFSQGTWAASPFDQKVFIENKGQFAPDILGADGENGNESAKILFSVSSAGVDLYFRANGLTYKHDEIVPMTEEENEKKERKQPMEEEEEEGEEREREKEAKRMKTKHHYLSIEWVGSNPNAEIVAEEPVSSYYTYGGSGKDANTTIKANACKKIIYKNLYPNIDVEYVLPEKGGLKYTLILRPQADVSVVKMKYKFAEGLHADKEGNIVIKSEFGNFVDHAPHTYYQSDNSVVNSEFVLSGNEIGFHVDNYDKSKTLIIDPWIMDPIFPSYSTLPAFNAACDVNYDVNGNVYIYGGWIPFRLMKYNNAGVLQWTYLASNFCASGADSIWGYYGDFAVDELSGTSYLVHGWGGGIIKVNTLGTQIAIGPGSLLETWRVEYSRCLKKIVAAGGGIVQPHQAFMLDTNMVAAPPVNVLGVTNAYHDICLLAIDPVDPFCYMAEAQNGSTSLTNKMIKCPIPNLIPSVVLAVDNGHKFEEVNSVQYSGHWVPFSNSSNGFNGMACSHRWLYTYDSDSLKRWDKNTGTLIAGIDVSSSLPTVSSGSIKIFWGGLSVDNCDNIYVGVMDTIKVYNSSLVQTGFFKLPNTVYDVKVSPNNRLYACGKAFVTEINVPPNNVVITMAQTSSCDSCKGTATVAAVSCSNPANFSYSWAPSGQTTQTATGLCIGNYTVTITVNCYTSYTTTVTITAAIGPTVTPTAQINVLCNGGSTGSATINVSGGTPAYTYNWNPLSGTTSMVTGLNAGNYTVIVTDSSGCSSTQTVTITEPAALTTTITPISATCNNNNGSASVSASGGTISYTYLWSNGQTTQTATGLTAGNYTIIVTDANNCTQTASVSITTTNAPNIISAPTHVLCNGDNTGSATVTANGGVSPYTYLWSNIQTTSTASGLIAGTYTITVTDSQGCISTKTVIITEPPALTTTPTFTPATCGNNDGTAAANPSGGTPGYNYTWNNGQITQTATGLGANSYTVIITDANGCTNNVSITVTEIPCPCPNLKLTLPNAFSPNNDGENDEICLQGGMQDCITELKVIIYNRWGEKVYESTNKNFCWDGVYQGKLMNTAVFVYHMDAVLFTGEAITKKGNISLIR